MHPRQMARSATWQRALTPAEMRVAMRAEEVPLATEDRMAALFADRTRDGKDTDHYDLTREGFTEAEVIKYAATAAGKADVMLQADIADDRVVYDREARVMLGAQAVAGMLLTDTGAVNTVLHQAGLATREIGNLYTDIIGSALRIVRESRPDFAVQ